jgi:hypothetical protein
MRFAVDMECEGQAVSSVVISLQNEDDAKALLERRSVMAFGHFCEVKPHGPTHLDQQCFATFFLSLIVHELVEYFYLGFR